MTYYFSWLCTQQREDGLWWIYNFNSLLIAYGGFATEVIARDVMTAINCKDEIKHLMNK